MSEISPLSPEARAHLPETAYAHESEAKWFARLGLTGQVMQVAKRVGVGVYSDGFIHAGNFAYLSLVSLSERPVRTQSRQAVPTPPIALG